MTISYLKYSKKHKHFGGFLTIAVIYCYQFMPKKLLTDAELWDAIVMDDSHAFTMLFERYWSKLYATAYGYLKDAETCEEIVHDIFLTIWDRRKQLQIESFQNYLISSARYIVYKKQRAIKNSPLQLVEAYSEIENPACNNTGDENIVYLELQDELDLYLMKLPKRCREIFTMSRRDHLSNDEIARQLNISKRSVENQITHALKFLRVSMKDIAIVVLIISAFK